MTENTARRVANLLWARVLKRKNPWVYTAPTRVLEWYQLQVQLARELFAVVFADAVFTDDLLERSLDFIDGNPQ